MIATEESNIKLHESAKAQEKKKRENSSKNKISVKSLGPVYILHGLAQSTPYWPHGQIKDFFTQFLPAI